METRKLSTLKPNPLNPRGPVVEDDGLRELAESIRSQGLLQPILITPKGLIVAGHRRAVACKLAEVSEVLVIVKDIDELEQIEIMLIENLQREDLNPLQQGKAMLGLRTRGLSVTTISKATGISRQRVDDLLFIAQMPQEIQGVFANKQLPLNTLSALKELSSPKEMIMWVNRAVDKEWSGNQLCCAIRQKKYNKGEPLSAEDIKQDMVSSMIDKLYAISDRLDYYDDLRHIAERVKEASGALVDHVTSKRKRGKAA
jgi:ParB/RepB/Spo0J family partition protein